MLLRAVIAYFICAKFPFLCIWTALHSTAQWISVVAAAKRYRNCRFFVFPRIKCNTLLFASIHLILHSFHLANKRSGAHSGRRFAEVFLPFVFRPSECSRNGGMIGQSEKEWMGRDGRERERGRTVETQMKIDETRNSYDFRAILYFSIISTLLLFRVCARHFGI